jgi:transposase
MEYINLKELNASELKQVRSQVVRLKEMGKTGKEIEELTGVRPNRISEIWTAYQREGKKALNPQKRGRKRGQGMTLTLEEAREIRETIVGKTPEQLKLAGFLWTLAKISAYILKTYRKKVSVRSLSNYMKRWGLTCQRPTKRACGQDIARIEKFKQEEYPVIAARAKAENADIYWGDETGASNRENFERGFAEKGHPPLLPLPTRKERENMISAITNKGHMRFMVYEEAMNQQLLIDFMRRLIADSKRKVFLILDNLRVHHGKIVAAWLEKHRDKIELFFIPPYAPESNPVEYLNHALKLDVHSGNLLRTKKDITHKIHSFMRRLQHHKERVAAFFNHKNVSYILLQE